MTASNRQHHTIGVQPVEDRADQAARWLMRVTDPAATTEMQAACAAWCAADPANAAAFAEARRFWQRGELELALAEVVDSLPPRVAPHRVTLRRWATLAAGLLLAVLLAGWALVPGRADLWLLADYRAPLHGLSVVTLEDGSRIHLDRAAAIDSAFTPGERSLRLRQGSIVVEAAPDANRPLVVRTGNAEIRVVGTRFLVAHGARADRIAVQEGKVLVRHGGHDVLLLPGQQVLAGPAAGADGLGTVLPVAPDLVADRAEGWRSFEAAPLGAVLDEIGRYRLAPLILADDALRTLPVTARLKVADPDAALAALADSLPIRLRGLSGGPVLVEARASNP